MGSPSSVPLGWEHLGWARGRQALWAPEVAGKGKSDAWPRVLGQGPPPSSFQLPHAIPAIFINFGCSDLLPSVHLKGFTVQASHQLPISRVNPSVSPGLSLPHSILASPASTATCLSTCDRRMGQHVHLTGVYGPHCPRNHFGSVSYVQLHKQNL